MQKPILRYVSLTLIVDLIMFLIKGHFNYQIYYKNILQLFFLFVFKSHGLTTWPPRLKIISYIILNNLTAFIAARTRPATT